MGWVLLRFDSAGFRVVKAEFVQRYGPPARTRQIYGAEVLEWEGASTAIVFFQLRGIAHSVVYIGLKNAMKAELDRLRSIGVW